MADADKGCKMDSDSNNKEEGTKLATTETQGTFAPGYVCSKFNMGVNKPVEKTSVNTGKPPYI